MHTRTLIVILIMLAAVIMVWYYTDDGVRPLPPDATSTVVQLNER